MECPLIFQQSLQFFNSEWIMGYLDNDTDQQPLDEKAVEYAILDLLPIKHYDLIISHYPSGEHTRHLRHEGKQVKQLLSSGMSVKYLPPNLDLCLRGWQ